MHKPGPLELGYPLNSATKSKSNRRFVTHFLHNQPFNMDHKEQNLQLAIADFKAGKFKFGSEAVRVYGVPLLTFNNRLNGKSYDKLYYGTGRKWRNWK